jgi:hypothetical protein
VWRASAAFFSLRRSRRLERRAIVAADATRICKMDACLPGRRRLRKRQLTAEQEIGWSESSAASSVSAFSLCEL